MYVCTYVVAKVPLQKLQQIYRMRGNVRGTKFSRFLRTAWASANYCGTGDYVMIIKWATRRAVHMLTLQNTTTIEQREQ